MPAPAKSERAVPLLEVFGAFLKLGLSAFGGPTAHLGFFRSEFVERRAWLSDRQYADLVALAQFLPGPASSQTGAAVGFKVAGWPGLLAAWTAFTLPSALVMGVFAGLSGGWGGGGWLAGLKLAALAVVAQAVGGLWSTLVTGSGGEPARLRTLLALATAAALLVWPGPAAQGAALVMCGLVGWRWLASEEAPAVQDPASQGTGAQSFPLSPRGGLLLIGLVLAGLALLPLLAPLSPAAEFAATVYRAGALVFGGGHVVLPLLQGGLVPEFVSPERFLAGYGVANAVPGPLFTFATYLGAAQGAFSPILGAVIGTLAIFLPGLLLMVGALPLWAQLAAQPGMRRALGGINAGVTGLLLAALYDPVLTSAVHSPRDLALALLAYAALTAGRVPVWGVVGGAALAGWALRLGAGALTGG